MKAQRIAAATATGLALTACGGTDAETTARNDAPETVALTVTMTDTAPLDVLYNYGHGRCYTSGPILDIIGKSRRLEVVVRDADGTIVGERDVPERGGTFERWRGGCEWSVTLDVDRSSAYEIRVSAAPGGALGTSTLTVADTATTVGTRVSLDQ